MTAPSIKTIKKGDSRFYVHPTSGELVPSVTTVLGIIDKPALKYWAANEVAKYAINHKTAWEGLPTRDAWTLLKGAPWRVRDDAADVGTDVHTYAENLLIGKASLDEPVTARPGDGNEVLMSGEAYANACEAVRILLRAIAPKVIATELTVWSHKYGFAGTFDGIFDVALFGMSMIDWKSSKDVYGEYSMQLAAYRHADEIIMPSGRSIPMPEIKSALLLHVPKTLDKEPTVVPVKADANDFEGFLGALDVYRWKRDHEPEAIGQRLTAEQYTEALAEQQPPKKGRTRK